MHSRNWLKNTLLKVITAVILSVASCSSDSSEQAGEPATEIEGYRPKSGTLELAPKVQDQLGLHFGRVEERNLSREIRLTGVVEPNVNLVVEVRPLTRGRLQSMAVTVGDRVRKGEVLAVYDDIELGDLISQRATAAAELQRARSEARVARESLKRAERLVEIGALAEAERERRQSLHEQALSRIGEAQTQVEQANRKLRRLGVDEASLEDAQAGGPASSFLTPLTAPLGGIVIATAAAEGEVIDPSEVLFQITDISSVWVQGDLHEKDIGLVRAGQMATVEVAAYPNRSFQGEITYISDILDPASRTARARCELANPQRELKLGMFATVTTAATDGESVLAVPSEAVQTVEEEQVVFVKASDREFRKRVVELGRKSEGWVEVLQGLSVGDEIVTQGSFELKAVLLRGSLAEED